MAKDTLYTKNFTAPTQITREQYTTVGSGINYLGDVLRAFKGSTDFEIWDSPSGGTQLTEGVDYDLKNQDTRMSSEAGYPVYTGYQITNVTYQTGNVYFTYKAIMSAIPAEYFNTERARVNALEYVGKVEIWPYDTLPNSKFQWCRGASLLRANFPELFAFSFRDVGVCTISNATPAVVTLNGHGLLTGACVSFKTTGALPTGLSVDTQYYVVYNDANSFWVASSLADALAGTKLATSSAGSGIHTLVSNPWGFADSTHFYLPNFEAVALMGESQAGRTVGGNTKYTYGLGATREDRGQTISGTVGSIFFGASSTSATGPFTRTSVTNDRGAAGANDGRYTINFDSSLAARAGATTEPNTAFVNYIIRTEL